jgi:hypothetical protein
MWQLLFARADVAEKGEEFAWWHLEDVQIGTLNWHAVFQNAGRTLPLSVTKAESELTPGITGPTFGSDCYLDEAAGTNRPPSFHEKGSTFCHAAKTCTEHFPFENRAWLPPH